MLAASGKVAVRVSGGSRHSNAAQLSPSFESHELDSGPSSQQDLGTDDRDNNPAPSSVRHGFLMECAANSGSRNPLMFDNARNLQEERISFSVLRSLDSTGEPNDPEVSEAVSSSPPLYATYPQYLPSGRLYIPSSSSTMGITPHFPDHRLAPSASNSPLVIHAADTVPHHLKLSMPTQTLQGSSTISPRPSPMFAAGQIGIAGEFSSDFRSMCEHIWRYNDQKTSLYLQERLKCCIPGEYEQLVKAIFENAMPLMVHRFGNFLVQCMLQLAKPEDIAALAKLLEGHIANLSKNQFCCHVIQRLLDVSSVVIQATIAAELLEDVVDTMCSPSGSHVWQKLLHLPWKYDLPPITAHANNAVHLPPNKRGWLTIAETEAGCATIKSFLGVSTAGPERQQCLDELLGALNSLMVDPVGSILAARIAMIAASRARALTIIFSNAFRYATHPVASGVLITLLHFKIPSFPSRLDNALAPHRAELYNTHYGRHVLAALDLSQARK